MKNRKRGGPRRAKDAPANARVAQSARYDAQTERLVFELDNGVSVAIPRATIGLADARPDLVAGFVLDEHGLGIEWPELDMSFCIPEMLPELALELPPCDNRRPHPSLGGTPTAQAAKRQMARRSTSSAGGRE